MPALGADPRVGSNVEERRERYGWSREELATRAGLTYQSIYNIEKSRVDPLLSNIRKVADALGVKVDTLTK